MSRSQQTLTIEKLLKEANPNISAIARQMGVSRGWVQEINRRLLSDFETVAEPANVDGKQVSNSNMKSLSIHLTPAVFDALVEACAVANRRAPEEPITITEYVEELVISRVVELGLLRRNKRK